MSIKEEAATAIVQVGIAGLQETQAKLLRAQALLVSPEGLPNMVGRVIIGLHRYVVANTHVGKYRRSKKGGWTYARTGQGSVGGGALRASHMVAVPEDMAHPVGRIYINPSAVNPMTKKKVLSYAYVEHARGGDHAFYSKSVADATQDGMFGRELQAFVEKVENA